MSSATTADKTEAPQKPGRKPMRKRTKIMLIVLSLLLMGVLRTGYMFLVIALLPSIVTYYIDQSRKQYIFKTIFASNLSGVMPYLAKMLHYGPSATIMEEIMGDGTNWFIIYGSALIGLMLVRLAPAIAQTMIGGFHSTQVMRLSHMQKRIENEWGKEVTQFSKVDEEEYDPWAIPDIKIRG